MRQIVLDTETTGLDPASGHRIVEVACVEIVNRRLTDKTYHQYLNPERASDDGALQVHGLTEEFLSVKPKFQEIVTDFIEFIAGAELIIHNAPFDVGFLNSELKIANRGELSDHVALVTDTLKTAKELHPGKRNNLDALCERYSVDNSARTLHGALLDARLLAEVYLAMTRGQDSLAMDLVEANDVVATDDDRVEPLKLVVVSASPEEISAHEAYLLDLDKASKGACLWKSMTQPSADTA